MSQRPRVDLDGVTLHDEHNPYMPLAVFRYRTLDGLILLVPESADVLVEWTNVESAALDLKAGQLRIGLSAEYVQKCHWLRGARVLVGEWLDRVRYDGMGPTPSD